MIRQIAILVAALGVALPTSVRAENAPPVGYHAVDLVGAKPAAKPPAQEVKILLDTPHLKLAMITLRDGKVLEEHSTPMPVTIQALRGRGTVQIGSAKEIVSTERMVMLAPGMKHAVVPEGKAELVLLVHHMKPSPGPGMGRGKGPPR